MVTLFLPPPGGPRRMNGVHQVPERQLSPVVPAAVIHKLPQQLNQRLGAVLLNCGMFRSSTKTIIFLPGGGPNVLSCACPACVDDVLGHVRRRLAEKFIKV